MGEPFVKREVGHFLFKFLFYLNILFCQLYARRLFSIILDARQEVAFMLLKEKFLENFSFCLLFGLTIAYKRVV